MSILESDYILIGNCIIKGRKGEEPPLFKVESIDGRTVISACKLNGYAIIPVEEYNQLKKKEASYQNSGLSWGVFNLWGDDRSIDEVRRLISVEGRADDLQREIIAMRDEHIAMRNERTRIRDALHTLCTAAESE